VTPTDHIKHFLVTRDPKEQKTTVREFGTDYDAAQDAYQEAEQQARGTKLDVVLLSAESLETIKRTHSSYFDEEPNIVGAAIGGALGGALGVLVGGPVGVALSAGVGGWLGHESEKDTREKS
jgi:outer membrane lipoprotein SlyB